MTPKKKPVLLQFDEDLVDRLDALSKELGRSRASVVRDAVERYVVQESVDLKDRQMAEAYRAIPDDDEFKALHERSARDLVGEEPW